MRFILLALILATTLAQVVPVPENDTVDPASLAFMKGFLWGLGEKPVEEDFKKCARSMAQIFNGIHSALLHLKHFSIANLAKGLALLFVSVKLLAKEIKPCGAQYKNLQKFLHGISHPSITHIVGHVIRHPIKFAKEVAGSISAFSHKDYSRAGTHFGGLMKLFFV